MTTLLNSCPWSGWLFWRQKIHADKRADALFASAVAIHLPSFSCSIQAKMKQISALSPQEKKMTDSVGIDHERWADIGLVL